MSMKLLREGIRTWLNSMVRIDVWDLDAPRNVPTVINGTRYPANCAVEIPVKDLSLKREAGYTEADGRFTYGLMYRFSGKAAKHQLPVSAVENLIMFLSEYAIVNPSVLWEDILGLEVENVSSPVGINRVEGEDQDWLIIGRLEMRIKFVANAVNLPGGFDNLQSPVLTQPPAPLVINQIQTGLYRAKFPVNPDDPTTYVKDQTIKLDIPLPDET